jgi:hypothetical protein
MSFQAGQFHFDRVPSEQSRYPLSLRFDDQVQRNNNKKWFHSSWNNSVMRAVSHPRLSF